MTEEKKRIIALLAVTVYAAAPLFLFGITGWRWRWIWTPPGVPMPWPLPLPLPVIVPEATT